MNRAVVFQKVAVYILAGAKYRDSCQTIFRRIKLLTIPALYMLESMLSISKEGRIKTIGEMKGRFTRNEGILLIPSDT